MLAKDVMQERVFTVREDDLAAEVLDAFVAEHIHGAPVLGDDGELVGFVTQQDLLFASMTKSGADGRGRRGSTKPGVKVRDIMTSPAVSASEDTEISRLCRMMFELRIHRVPITRAGKVTGIVSSLDICGAFARGDL
jgi:CBS domain-containing protein